MDKKRRKGFPSIFDATYNEGWELKNVGYDYNDNLLENTMSNYMFRNNNLSTFLKKYLNPIMALFINKVKYLRVFYNYTVPKDYQKIN